MTKARSVRLAQAGLASAALMTLGASSGLPSAGAVDGASGTVVQAAAFPTGTGLAHVGCTDPFTRGAGPATPYVAMGPGQAPAGARSLGFDLAGGDGAGPVAYTGSLAAEGVASVAVHAEQGTTGVAWIGLRDADDPAGVVWFGRAALDVPAGGWSRVTTAGLELTWAQYDTTTGAPVAGGPTATATVAAMLAEHGDGPGLVALTLGCDGAPFFLDAWQVGSRSFDFEGLQTAMTMRGVDQSLVAGESTTVRGDFGLSGGRVPHATAILEKQTDGAWETVRVVDAGAGGFLTTTVEPPKRTAYRWRFVDRPLAAGSVSSVVVVDVAFAVRAEAGDRVVSGAVSPGLPGVTVTLRRAGTDEVVATGTTSGGGDYSLPTEGLTDGRYVVRAEATAMNQQGRSQPVQLTGARPAPADPSLPPVTPSAEPSPEASADPSPSATASAEPSATPSASPTPTGTPSPQPSGTPEATASPTSTPSGPSPSPTAAGAPVDPSLPPATGSGSSGPS